MISIHPSGATLGLSKQQVCTYTAAFSSENKKLLNVLCPTSCLSRGDAEVITKNLFEQLCSGLSCLIMFRGFAEIEVRGGLSFYFICFLISEILKDFEFIWSILSHNGIIKRSNAFLIYLCFDNFAASKKFTINRSPPPSSGYQAT